jgi:hypothetical protein
MDIDHADVAVAALEAFGALHEPGTSCPAELAEVVNQLLNLRDTDFAPSPGSRETSPVRYSPTPRT